MSTSSQLSKFICLTCGHSLDQATSICTCGGRATRRPRPESEVLEEENKKLIPLLRFQKLYYVILIIYVVSLITAKFLLGYNETLAIIILVAGLIITPIFYFVASFLYNRCPYCNHSFDVRKLYNEKFCPYCGKSMKPSKYTNQK